MNRWVEEKRDFFERDILQDFCRFCRVLEEQFSRFETSGMVSSPVLHVLVGDFSNKGLLWRLKDNAHLVFRVGETYNPAGRLLDWTLGYIYHECVKLMEDAHLIQSYSTRLRVFSGHACMDRSASLLEKLNAIQAQTGGSMEREVARLKELIALARQLFCLYFAGRSEHRPLARLLYDKETLIREVFRDDYPEFLAAVYGNAPERLYVEAACSLMESARADAAGKAAAEALARNPHNEAALDIARRLEKAEPASA